MSLSTRSLYSEIAIPALDPRIGAYPVYGGNRLTPDDDTLKTRSEGRGYKVYRDILKDCHAITKTAQLVSRLGCAPRVLSWNVSSKGVDDLVMALGREFLEQVVRDALSLETWQARQYGRLFYPPDLKLCLRYLVAPLPPSAQLIAVKSPKDTGKTEWLSQQVVQAIRNGQRVLVLVHRTQLGEALCQRFGIDYVTAMRNSPTRGVLGIGLCVDSLHPNSQAQFDPEDWHDAVVIIDEAEQVFWHLLNSNTCRKERVSILRNFKALIQNVLNSDEGKVFLSDADLSDIAIDYVRSLVGFPIRPHVAGL